MNDQSSNHTISILGCGWLGLPLATKLSSEGYRVKASTTSSEKIQLLSSKGLHPYLLDIREDIGELEEFCECRTLVVAVPPSLRHGKDGETYVNGLRRVAETAKSKNVHKVIFISSTGVYPDTNTVVDEQTPVATDERSGVLRNAEKVWAEVLGQDRAIVIRSAGLMGYNRIPGRYFAGKKDLDTSHIPVNYIHRDDIVEIIRQMIITSAITRGYYNAAAPLHPTRKEVYHVNAKAFGFEMPTFSPDTSKSYKIVDGGKLAKELGYSFKYPDPLKFEYEENI